MLCSYCVVTSDHWLYQTAKSRFQRCVPYRNNVFFFFFFFSFLSSSKVVLSCGCCVEPHNYDSHVAVRATFLTEHCGTFVKFLPQPLFLGCLLRFCPPGSASFSFYARHGLLDWLVCTITSLVFSICFAFTCKVLARISKVAVMSLLLVLAITNSPLLSIFPFQNWGCVHYTGKSGNVVHRGTMLASFWGFLKVSADMTVMGYNDRIFRFY